MVDKMEKEFSEKLIDKKELEEQLMLNIDEKEKYIKDLEQERNAYLATKKQMEGELIKANNSHDAEIQLRMKFEAKLNQVHSIYNDLQQRVIF